jgi:PAS domain S-box-containing protein
MNAKELKVKENQRESGLRGRAEEKLKVATRGNEEISGMSPEKMTSLIHELEVHQIELEMQNEELRHIQKELEKTRDEYSHLYDFAPVGYFTVSEKGIIEEANLTGASLIGIERNALIGKPFTRFVQREDQDIFYEHRQRLLETETRQSCDLRLVKKNGHEFFAHLECLVVKKSGDDSRLIRGAVIDITDRKQAEADRDKFILKLQETLDRVKTLSGLLPICAHCKNVRNDKGYWNRIETFIKDHSEAEFSHGICPECAKKYYPDFEFYDDSK